MMMLTVLDDGRAERSWDRPPVYNGRGCREGRNRRTRIGDHALCTVKSLEHER